MGISGKVSLIQTFTSYTPPPSEASPRRHPRWQVCHIRGSGVWTRSDWWRTSILWLAIYQGSKVYLMKCQHCDKTVHTHTQTHTWCREGENPLHKHISIPANRQHSLNRQVTHAWSAPQLREYGCDWWASAHVVQRAATLLMLWRLENCDCLVCVCALRACLCVCVCERVWIPCQPPAAIPSHTGWVVSTPLPG